MPRTTAAADAYSAIAEPRRRDILDVLARGGAQPVGTVVKRLRLPQPVVSKHLGVLLRAGMVSVTRRGRQRLYELDVKELKQVHEWVKTYEQFWSHQLDRIKQRAERKHATKEKPSC